MAFRKLLSLVLSIFMIGALSLLPCMAENDEPLTLRSSTVVDGDTDLSVRPVIELQFSKKIADILILEHNKDCFHLQDASGAVVPLTVLFPDTQLQSRYVYQVFLMPEQDLAPGAAYTLTVDDQLIDKKENTLDRAYTIGFTTATDETFATAKENEDLMALEGNLLEYQTALPPAAGSAADASPTASADAEQQAGEDTSVRTVIFIAVPLLLALLGFVFYRNLKASKQGSSTAP